MPSRELNYFYFDTDDFSDLEINSSPNNGQFYYFRRRSNGSLVTRFVLKDGPNRSKLCEVTLIKNDDIFEPRLHLTIRASNSVIVEEEVAVLRDVKASVNLDDCQANFWKLIDFLVNAREIDIPRSAFTLASREDARILEVIRGLNQESFSSLIQGLELGPDVVLTRRDLDALLKTRQKLEEFDSAIDQDGHPESWWQNFFEKNHWIFGYGLKYVVLHPEQPQPYYGGQGLDGTGAQRGDFITSSTGNLKFVVLVEIKKPTTRLLRGLQPIRNGAWGLSNELTDAVTQLQANLSTWELEGSRTPRSRDALEDSGVYTVAPKGIIVIGNLNELIGDRDKHQTFHRFRNSLQGIEIITFDELLERARFIVENE